MTKKLMRLFDSHCHLDDKLYDNDRNEVIKRAESYGVLKSMVVGVSSKSSVKAVELANTYQDLYASVGIHPHDVKTCSEEMLKGLIKLANNPCVKAWGEIGLDFNRMFSPAKTQEKWFIRQLEAADNLNLPLIYHERDSNGKMLELLNIHKKKDRTGVIHCFSGTLKEMVSYLDLGLHIGVTGILTIKGRGKYLRSIVSEIPIDKILIETDAPYLTPAPEKNKVRRNEPAFVKSILLKLAQVRGEEPEYLAEKIWENTCNLFRI